MNNTKSTQSASLPMGFREKTAWATLAIMLVVFVPYFAHMLRLFNRGELGWEAVLGEFIGAVILQVILAIIVAIAIAIRSKEEPKDERDLAIEAKSYKNAYFVLGFFCVFAMGWMIMYAMAAGGQAATSWLTPIAISQLVLLCFVIAEATKYGTQAVCYRRGS